MSFQGPQLLLAISWILRSKKNLLASLTVFLKLFQYLSFLDALYLSRDWLHSLFYYFLECFIILTCLAFLPHTHLMFDARRLTISSSLLQSVKLEVLRFLMIVVTSLTNVISSLLFFDMESLDELTFSLAMGIDTVRGVWSEMRHRSGWIEWLLSSIDPLRRNIRLMTEFTLPAVSEYLIVMIQSSKC